MSPSIEKYLLRYADPLCKGTPDPPEPCDVCVCVPICGETESLPRLIKSLEVAAKEADKTVLMIGVINSNPSTLPKYRQSNSELLGELPPFRILTSEFYYRPGERVGCLFVDRHSTPFGHGEGVGLARKIAADMALFLYFLFSIRSPWFYTTDGDATVSDDYFLDCDSQDIAGLYSSPVGAEIFPFVHEANENSALTRAHLRYETWLHSYHTGLKFSGSPFAYWSIGSTIRFHANTYAEVRGFPKREAAEDFYFLNKIAKVAGIRIRQKGLVTLHSRESQRVPFGTGRSVLHILDGTKHFAPYPQDVFEILRATLGLVEEGLQENLHLPSLPGELAEIYAKANERRSPQDRFLHFHRTFDGARTFKFINSLLRS